MQAAPKAKIENRYYQRAAGTAKACWICYKETTTVLATLDKADFLYVCPSHLTDRNFATSLAAPTPPADAAAASGPTKEQIAAVIAEYEARKGKDKDKAKSADDKEKGDGKKAESPGAYLTPSAPAPAPMPTHNVFALHRDFYAMRLAELRKRDNLVKANAVSKELPRPPSNLFPLARPRPTGDGGGAL